MKLNDKFKIILGVVIIVLGIVGLFLPILQGIILILLGIYLVFGKKPRELFKKFLKKKRK